MAPSTKRHAHDERGHGTRAGVGHGVERAWALGSGEESAGEDAFDDAADGDVHGGVAHGEPLRLGQGVDFVEALAHPLGQALFDLVERHLLALGFLRVFQVGDEHAAGVAEDVGDDEARRGG